MDEPTEKSAQGRLALRGERRRRRRFSSLCFFVAGLAFGSAFYLLRAHIALIGARPAPFLALVALMVVVFWMGARAETEIVALDEQLRALDAAALAARRRPRRLT